jgi:hypothetical protein
MIEGALIEDKSMLFLLVLLVRFGGGKFWWGKGRGRKGGGKEEGEK